MNVGLHKLSKRLRGCACVVIFIALIAPVKAQLQGTQPTDVATKLDISSLCKLVETMNVVSLKYHYDRDMASARVFHPYAVGFTPSRNVLLFGLQVGGYSKSAQSDSTEGWRSFRTDKIVKLAALGTTFTPVRPQLPGRNVIANYECENKLAKKAG